MEGVFNDKVCIYGFGKQAKNILEQLTLAVTNARKYYLDENIFSSSLIDEEAKIDAVLHNYYKSEVIILIGNQANIKKSCEIFRESIDFENKCIIAFIFDNGDDKEIMGISNMIDATVVMPFFYVDILTNTGLDEDKAQEIVLNKTIKSFTRIFNEKSQLNNSHDMLLYYAKDMGLSTIFFDSIGFDEPVGDRFDYIDLNGDTNIFCVVEGQQCRENLFDEIQKAITHNNLKKKNKLTMSLCYTFYKNREFADFNTISLFVMGY